MTKVIKVKGETMIPWELEIVVPDDEDLGTIFSKDNLISQSLGSDPSILDLSGWKDSLGFISVELVNEASDRPLTEGWTSDT